jgi:phage terminase large subunit GpA-like protein
MTDVIQQAWSNAFAARDRRPIPDWAHDHVWLSPPITRTGRFDVSSSRHFVEIFDALKNDYRREVNILKPVRGGGSLIGDVLVLWAMVNDPGPYMELFQTDRVAAEHAEARLMPNFRNCRLTADLFPHDRHKLRDQQIQFNHGHTWYVSGPSIGNLQTKGVRWLRLEEVWMWAQGKEGEAVGRIGDYLKMHTSKVLRISQGGPMDGVEMEQSDWYRAYHRGIVHEWEAACPGCGKHYMPQFSGQREDGSFWGMTWDRHQLPNGDWDIYY